MLARRKFYLYSTNCKRLYQRVVRAKIGCFSYRFSTYVSFVIFFIKPKRMTMWLWQMSSILTPLNYYVLILKLCICLTAKHFIHRNGFMLIIIISAFHVHKCKLMTPIRLENWEWKYVTSIIKLFFCVSHRGEWVVSNFKWISPLVYIVSNIRLGVFSNDWYNLLSAFFLWDIVKLERFITFYMSLSVNKY